jgi:hypothetical protein
MKQAKSIILKEKRIKPSETSFAYRTGQCVSIIVGDCETLCKANPLTAIIAERG